MGRPFKMPGHLKPEPEPQPAREPEDPSDATASGKPGTATILAATAASEEPPGSGSGAAALGPTCADLRSASVASGRLAPSSGPGSDLLPQLLLAYYDSHRRELPWRQDTDPYRVWISEVMLQQTRVETVIPYYARWLRRFPDVTRLADAPGDDVLKAWEGLGYYSRARNLHRAARLLRERHAGELPSDPEALKALPGFGEYTVGAVASIAFGRRLPAVDGNVRRVLARLYDVAQPAATWLRATAAALVPADRPGDYNQALMELGATVCTPRSPRCDACPIACLCLARARGTVAERPAPRRRAPVRTLELATALLGDEGGRWLLVRNGGSGLLAGLWGFPSAEASPGESVTAAAARAALCAGLEVAAAGGEEIGSVRHQFSHFTAVYRAVRFPPPPAVPASGGEATSGGGAPSGAAPRADPGSAAWEPAGSHRTAARASDGETRWVTSAEARALALPVAQRKLLEMAEAARQGRVGA